MSWGENQSLAAKRRALEQHFREPRFLYVVVELIPVEPNDRHGYVCPLTGDPKVRGLEVIHDFSYLIDTKTMARINAWDSPEAMERVGRFAAMAEPYETCTGHVAELRVQFKTPQSRIAIIQEEKTETTYFSGGWRSGKSYVAMQKWQRRTMKFGGEGRRSWLVGPQRANAWRLAEAIYRGRAGTPALFPTRGRDEYGLRKSAFVADRLPKDEKAQSLKWRHRDGTVIEAFHARGGGGHLEGEAAICILFDEARLIEDSDAFDVIRGRVMGDMGQVIVASVPDDNAPWLYEKVVSEAERQKQWAVPGVRMLTLNGYENPWIPDEAIKRREDNETDPIVKEQKIYGRWTMRGLYAYSDVYDPALHERDYSSEDYESWGFGADITRHVSRSTCAKKVGDYIIGVDFNWQPQTRLVFKFFGEQGDPSTWKMVAVDELITSKADAKEAARELRRRNNGQYAGSVVVADCNGFHSLHKYGGQESKHFDKFYYEDEKFKAVAPIHIKNTKTRKTTYSNPGIGASRTLIRELIREGQFFIIAGRCPRFVNAMAKAPNRRKLKKDAGSWLDREVYNLEDACRYVAWRVFERFKVRKKKKNTVNGKAVGARAQ
ncbi:MAG: hypothetical protein ACRBN8_22470 [Nannocystales bacterium]